MEIASSANRVQLLPARFGPRPRSSVSLPFRQLDQFPTADMQRRLLELSLDLPHVHARQSRVASPQCRALCVDDSAAGGPPEAFIDAHEFCHLHPLPEGYIHLTLPLSLVEGVHALGWAERHPLHTLSLMESLVMVYAPRDASEVDIVMRLIECSARFAMGAAGVAIARSVA
jgi:phospholipase/carboxylesterase